MGLPSAGGQIQGRGWLGLHVAKLVALLILGVSFLVPTGGSARTDALPRYFDSIVFEGGGVKGAVYAGALVALDEHKVLSNVKKFAGTSAGSTVAALLAAGYSSCELSSVTLEVSFADLVEFPLFPRLKQALYGIGTISLGRKLKTQKGLFSGNKLERTLDKLLGRKRCAVDLGIPFDNITMADLHLPSDGSVNDGDGDTSDIRTNVDQSMGRCATFRKLTFQQLFKSTGLELSVTGFDITNGTLVYFSRKTEPDMLVSKAVRISSSIPLVFEPVEWRGHLFMDGGVLRRIPVDAYETDESMLAMKIMADYSGTSPQELETLPLKAFVQRFTRAIFKQTQDLDLVQRAKARGVQFIDFSSHESVRSVSGVNFELSEVAKTRMWMAGYWSTREMLEAFSSSPWERTHLPCMSSSGQGPPSSNVDFGADDCSSQSSCAWAQNMLSEALRADTTAKTFESQYSSWFTASGLRFAVVALALFALTSLMAVCRNGVHLIAVQNYSGIRTQRCDHCLRMWVPSQLPANQVQDLSLDEVARALKARGIVVHVEEQAGSESNTRGPRIRSGSV
eukprot:g591.t1